MPRSLVVAMVVGFAAGCPADAPDPLPDDAPLELALETDEELGAFLSVWGPAPDDVYAVGGQVETLADPGVGTMLHRDTDAWRPVELPVGTPQLNWIHGDGSPRDGGATVWAVGNAGMALRATDADWELVDTGAGVPLWGVWVLGPDAVWAVGGNAFVAGSCVIMFGSRGAWQRIEVPELDREIAALFKVWATAEDDVWAVGDNGVILHYDGSAWSQVPSGTVRDLISLWGTGTGDIVAVGGRDIGVLTRYDGERWRAEDVGMLPGLNGVWMDTEGTAMVVGTMGRAAIVTAGGFATDPVASGAGTRVLHAVYGFADGTRYAVGGTLDRSPPLRGVIVERTRP